MEFTKFLVKDGEVPILEEGVNIFFMQEVAVLLDITTMNVYLPERILYNIKTLGIRWLTATEPGLVVKDCTKEFCGFQLDPDYKLRYLLNVPDDLSVEECTGCTMSMELIHEGKVCVSIASRKMVKWSEAKQLGHVDLSTLIAHCYLQKLREGGSEGGQDQVWHQK